MLVAHCTWPPVLPHCAMGPASSPPRNPAPAFPQSIFALMAEVEHEELVTTLETIVERLGSAIAPYAVDLSRQLCEALAKLVSADDDENEAGIMVSSLPVTFAIPPVPVACRSRSHSHRPTRRGVALLHRAHSAALLPAWPGRLALLHPS